MRDPLFRATTINSYVLKNIKLFILDAHHKLDSMTECFISCYYIWLQNNNLDCR